MRPNKTDATEMVKDARAPQITRENMSWPMPSSPKGWARLGPSPAWRMNFLSGAGMGSHGAKTALSTIAAIQMIASQPTMPRSFVLAFSTTTGLAPGPAVGSSTIGATPAGTTPAVVVASGDGSGMADPWVEDGVHDVDDEVHGDVAQRQDRDVALQRDVLAAEDGIRDEEAHPVDHEDVLDHHRAADERTDVQAGHGEQREARRPQRVAPQDAA